MIFWIVKGYYDTKGQEYNGMGKGIAILSSFTQKPLKGKRRT